MKFKKNSRLGILIFALIAIGFLNLGCAGPVRSVAVSPPVETGVKEVKCVYPFEPSNPLALLIFYKDGMHYITHQDDTCRHAFADELKKEVQSSILTPDGCVKVTLEDIEDALYHPEELRIRLKYY